MQRTCRPAAAVSEWYFQNYALMPHMTVFENIAFPLRVRRLPASEISRKVAEVLELIRLPDVAKRKPVELSGGQQQRVSLARCIVYNPSLILLDEPLGALDRKLREQMQLEIKRIHGELGITMLNVTHDQDEALTMSDRIVLMNRGRIEQDSRPSELYFQPATVFAADFLGDANLLAGEVVESGESVRLKTGFGSIAASRPSFQVCTGDAVTVMVRPDASMSSNAIQTRSRITSRASSRTRSWWAASSSITCSSRMRRSSWCRNRIGCRGRRCGRVRRLLLAWSESDCRVLPASGVQRGRGSNVGLPA
jgi:ABC-type Fe3+/spermidine/putrescine transport system ATPase subunit